MNLSTQADQLCPIRDAILISVVLWDYSRSVRFPGASCNQKIERKQKLDQMEASLLFSTETISAVFSSA